MSLIITSTVMSAIQPILSQSFILNRHTITGYTLICLVLVMAFTGVTSRFLSPRYNKFATRISEMNRSFHKNMGMLIYSLGITNGYFGWSDFAILNSPVVSDQSPNIYLAFAIIVPLSIFTYGEYITGTFSRYGFVQQGSSSKNSSRRTTINNMHLPEFSWSDIEKRIRSGRKWLVIEGVIYDVDSIIPNHPGGDHVISTMIGRDATKEFNGEAFSISAPKSNITSGFKLLDSNNSIFPVFERKHDHSRFARFQLLSNAIGVVKTVGEVNLLAAASSGHDLNISNHSISGGRVDGGAAGVYSSRMLLPSDASHIKPQVSKIPNAKIGSRLNLTSDIVVVETSQEISPDTATIQTMHTSNDSSSSPKRTIAVAKSSLQQNIILKSSTSRSDLSNLVQLNDEEYQYQILEKSLLSTSTSADRKVYLLKVSLKASYDVLLAPPNSSIMFKFKANDGSVIQRAYTPIYHVNRGNVEFIIKFINGKVRTFSKLQQYVNLKLNFL